MTKEEKPNQCERIVKYINDFGSITTREAMIDLGIYRLASRIYDLTRKDYEFDRKREEDKNRYGETTHFIRYKIKKSNAWTKDNSLNKNLTLRIIYQKQLDVK